MEPKQYWIAVAKGIRGKDPTATEIADTHTGKEVCFRKTEILESLVTPVEIKNFLTFYAWMSMSPKPL